MPFGVKNAGATDQREMNAIFHGMIGRKLEDDNAGRERVVYYLSKLLTDTDGRYSVVEKLCLALYFIESMKIIQQANGQAEASNKVIISILQKTIDDNPRAWHKILPETLWAYRISKRTNTVTSPFALTYGHDAVLPMELVVPSLGIMKQHDLSAEEYSEAMNMELEQLDEGRMEALNWMIVQKKKIAKAYNKKVKKKVFYEGQMVWKVILPPGIKDRELGKWSPI
ncbi:uncharacterized protein LOC119991515 [Tripterygium wilfordii]|uniref:uncharacterized protein LOC119991515 n=1 Tax=Tripterygium wilfordii TaxID=458696 RepID=UPI0018F7FDAC|nr:uncharacterized protein LOC119991515 [Tripterygium wilfordii]